MTEAAEVQRLQNLLAAETKERKKVQAEIQEMKRILQNKSPPTIPIMSPNDTSESVAMGMPRPPAATVQIFQIFFSDFWVCIARNKKQYRQLV